MKISHHDNIYTKTYSTILEYVQFVSFVFSFTSICFSYFILSPLLFLLIKEWLKCWKQILFHKDYGIRRTIGFESHDWQDLINEEVLLLPVISHLISLRTLLLRPFLTHLLSNNANSNKRKWLEVCMMLLFPSSASNFYSFPSSSSLLLFFFSTMWNQLRIIWNIAHCVSIGSEGNITWSKHHSKKVQTRKYINGINPCPLAIKIPFTGSNSLLQIPTSTPSTQPHPWTTFDL